MDFLSGMASSGVSAATGAAGAATSAVSGTLSGTLSAISKIATAPFGQDDEEGTDLSDLTAVVKAQRKLIDANRAEMARRGLTLDLSQIRVSPRNREYFKAAPAPASPHSASPFQRGAPPEVDGWIGVGGCLASIAVDKDIVAGVNSAGRIFYTSPGSPDWTAVDGVLKQVSISGKSACGVQGDGGVWRAADITAPKWKRVGGSLTQVAMSGSLVCGVNGAGHVMVSLDSVSAPFKRVEGDISYIAVWRKRAVGLSASNGVLVTDNVVEPSWRPINGKLVQASIWGNSIVGVTSDGNVLYTTWDRWSWDKLPGKAKCVGVNDKFIYRVEMSGAVSYRKL